MKKNIQNEANKFSLTSKFLQRTGQPVPLAPEQDARPADKDENVNHVPEDKPKSYDWDRWTIVISKEVKAKVMAIASKEGFSIREVLEKFLNTGIDAYEAKHGKVSTKKRKGKSIDKLI